MAAPHLRPMLASLVEAPLEDPQLVYEPKYDGIRAIADVPLKGPVRLWSRLGNEKTAQFPEVAAALGTWRARLKASVVLDGEIVALDDEGRPTGFQQLQGRIHVADAALVPEAGRAAFIVFDLLRDGSTDLRDRPLVERRAALERLFKRTRSTVLRVSEQVRGDGRALYERALAQGWEGLIAKRADSRYRSGKRTPDWRKLKIVHEQEFVVGGWTEPRHSREHFGALLLGVYDHEYHGGHGHDHHGGRGSSRLGAPGRRGARSREDKASVSSVVKRLVYVGHAGTGFDEHKLARVMSRLKALETRECPFSVRPDTNEKPHWVRPELVAQIKFAEWTGDNRLRHPVYLGLRDDKLPDDVHRESTARLDAQTRVRLRRSGAASEAFDGQALVDQLRAIEDSRHDGVLVLPDGDHLSVSNLHKVFWPAGRLTKGDAMRYYAQVAPVLLPVVADRALVMKRLPNGVAGQSFYQQRAPEGVPSGVRVEKVSVDTEVPGRLVGGGLTTLLYMTQLAAVSQDPWFSRVSTPDMADHAALDLDPMPEVTFARVLDVARWIRDELHTLGAVAFPKTSGADGLHIFIPLPPGTPYEAGLLFCQIVATVVAHKHPKHATIERSVRARGTRVYVDYLQNILGKTLACAYSARASDYAGVSTPLTWAEVDEGVRREDFTIRTVPGRIAHVGDLWKGLRTSNGIDLARVARYAER